MKCIYTIISKLPHLECRTIGHQYIDARSIKSIWEIITLGNNHDWQTYWRARVNSLPLSFVMSCFIVWPHLVYWKTRLFTVHASSSSSSTTTTSASHWCTRHLCALMQRQSTICHVESRHSYSLHLNNMATFYFLCIYIYI